MLYRLLGRAVWRFASAHIRHRYGRHLRAAAALAALSLAVAGYLAARSDE